MVPLHLKVGNPLQNTVYFCVYSGYSMLNADRGRETINLFPKIGENCIPPRIAGYTQGANTRAESNIYRISVGSTASEVNKDCFIDCFRDCFSCPICNKSDLTCCFFHSELRIRSNRLQTHYLLWALFIYTVPLL